MSAHRYQIKVTQADIDAGVRNSTAHCIVGTALGMQVPEATYISIDSQTVRFSLKDERLNFLTPPAVREYVIAFDAGDFAKLKPIDFVLAEPMITARSVERTAGRLIVKSGKQLRKSATVPSRSRAFGQRVFRVNQKNASAK